MSKTKRLNVSPAVRMNPSSAIAGPSVSVTTSTSPAHARSPEHETSDAYTQARAVLETIEKALKEAGASITDVVRTVVYLRDIDDAEGVAKAHLETFDKVRPASTLIQVTSMLRPWQRWRSRPTPNFLEPSGGRHTFL